MNHKNNQETKYNIGDWIYTKNKHIYLIKMIEIYENEIVYNCYPGGRLINHVKTNYIEVTDDEIVGNIEVNY